MLLIGEGIDGGDVCEVGEVDDVLLRVGADDGTVDHAAHDAGGVLDVLAPAELDIVFGEEHDVASELADADLEGDAGAGGGFGEDEGPGLSGERLGFVCAAGGFHFDGEVDKGVELDGAGFFDGEEVHGERSKGRC